MTHHDFPHPGLLGVMKIMAHHDCHPILSNERKIMTHHDFPHPGLLGVMKIMAHHDYHPITQMRGKS